MTAARSFRDFRLRRACCTALASDRSAPSGKPWLSAEEMDLTHYIHRRPMEGSCPAARTRWARRTTAAMRETISRYNESLRAV
jgi:hypothetical protein